MNFIPRPFLRLLQRCARVVVPALVVPKDRSIRFSHAGKLLNAVGHDLEAFFALSQRLLRALHLVNVSTSPKPLDDTAGGSSHRLATHEKPAIAAICCANAAFNDVGVAGSGSLVPGVPSPLFFLG